MALKHTHAYLEKGTKPAATLSALTSSLLKPPHGSPSRKHVPRTCESCGKGGDPRELLWQEVPGAARDTVAGRGRAGHTGAGTVLLAPMSGLRDTALLAGPADSQML